FESLLGPDHPAVARFLMGHAYTLLETQRPHQAIPLLERATLIFGRSFPEGHSHLLDTQDVLARAFEAPGDSVAASNSSPRTYPHWIRLLPAGGSVSHCQMIANFFVRQRSYQEAKAVSAALTESWETNPLKNVEELEGFIEATAAAKGWAA